MPSSQVLPNNSFATGAITWGDLLEYESAAFSYKSFEETTPPTAELCQGENNPDPPNSTPSTDLIRGSDQITLQLHQEGIAVYTASLTPELLPIKELDIISEGTAPAIIVGNTLLFAHVKANGIAYRYDNHLFCIADNDKSTKIFAESPRWPYREFFHIWHQHPTVAEGFMFVIYGFRGGTGIDHFDKMCRRHILEKKNPQPFG